MRIFLSCQQALRRHPVPAYDFWQQYFKNGIAEAGHEWCEAPEVDWAEGLTVMSPAERARWLGSVWSQTVETIKSIHAKTRIDLVLCYLFPQQVEPAAVAAVRSLGIPCVNFFCDNVREFTRVPAAYRPFDLHWVPEAEGCALYKKAGLPFVYAPMPCWIHPRQRCLTNEETGEAVFIGSHDVLREELLAQAVALGLALSIRGPGWTPDIHKPATTGTNFTRKIANQFAFLQRHGLRGLLMRPTYPERNTGRLANFLGPSVSNDAYFELTRKSSVTIGINRYPSFQHSFHRPHTYSRLRDIEAPMLGACYLTEEALGLADLYEPGTEIETYKNADELAEKTARLLADPGHRAELRRNAQRRALSEHTIGRSLEKIFARLKH